MGGLISIDLATKYDVEAVVTINTPIYYWNFGRIAANVIHDLWCCRMGNIKRYFKASGSVTYSALISFIRLLQYTKKQVTKLDCPFYVIQALDDDTVKTKSARYIYQNIKSQKKYLKYYETGGHLLLRSATANTVIADIEGFLSALE
jgi:carboxylesterase